MAAEQAFIVVEGTETPQHLQRLQTRLEANGYSVVRMSFPQLDQPSGFFVREYLRGAYGEPHAVGPYTQSLFQALDHFHAGYQIKEALAQGKVVLADRYTTSTMLTQAARLTTDEARRNFFLWVHNLEYQMLRVPRPTASFMLQDASSTEPSQSLMQLLPETVQVLRSGPGHDSLDEALWASVQPLLPKTREGTLEIQKKQAAHAYYVPSKLDEEQTQKYKQGLDQIYSLYEEMLPRLTEHLHDEQQASAVLNSVLPVASFDVRLRRFPAELQTAVKQSLTNGHSTDVPAVTLANAWPRNEFSLIPSMVFSGTGSLLRPLQDQTADLPYEARIKIMEAYLAKGLDQPALDDARYTWDLLSGYNVYREVTGSVEFLGLQHQALTPRYGYEVPKVIDDADLTDSYLECFDLSLQLYSALQQAGYEHEAQYVTLLGHKVRWTGNCTAKTLLQNGTELSDEAQKLLERMRTAAAEVHPTLIEIGEALPKETKQLQTVD